MNRSFWLGFGTGVAAVLLAILARLALADGRSGSAARAPGESSPAADDDNSEKIPADLFAAREEARMQRARADFLEAALGKLRDENSPLKPGREEATKKAAREEEKDIDPHEKEIESLRYSLKIGEDLDSSLASWLGLDAAQQQHVNELLRQEAQRMYTAMRQLGTEVPGATLPPRDGPALPQVLSSWLSSEPEKMNRLRDVLAGIRRETLDSIRPVIPEDRRRVADRILGPGYYRWRSFSLRWDR